MKKLTLSLLATLFASSSILAMQSDMSPLEHQVPKMKVGTTASVEIPLEEQLTKAMEVHAKLVAEKKVKDELIVNLFNFPTKSFSTEGLKDFIAHRDKAWRESTELADMIALETTKIESLTEEINLKKEIEKKTPTPTPTPTPIPEATVTLVPITSPIATPVPIAGAFSEGTLLRSLLDSSDHNKQITSNVFSKLVGFYRSLADKNSSDLLRFCNEKRGGSLTMVTFIDDTVVAQPTYLASVTDQRQLEKNLMNVGVIYGTTTNGLAREMTCWDMFMCHIGGFVTIENRWDNWVVELRNLVNKGKDGVFLKPLAVLDIKGHNHAKDIVKSVKQNKHVARGMGFLKNPGAFLTGEKTMRGVTKKYAAMFRNSGID